MADFSGLNSTLNSPNANVELLNCNLNVKQLKNRKNLNPVNVSSKIMKMLQESENLSDQQSNENQNQQIRIETRSSTPPPPPKVQPQPHPQLEDLIRERNQQKQQKKIQKEELNNLITIEEQTEADKNKVNILFFIFWY